MSAPHVVQERPLTALDAIFTRRSVRSFAREKLDAATVRSLLDAAVQAPTAVHLEPWAFVIVQDAAVLRRVSDRAKASWATEAEQYRGLHSGVGQIGSAFVAHLADPEFNVFYDASTLIAICAKPLGPFVAADCWLAAENLMLAACALGLGTCCIGSAVPALNSADTRSELSIPLGIQVVAPIVIGVPIGPTIDVPRHEPEILCWK